MTIDELLREQSRSLRLIESKMCCLTAAITLIGLQSFGIIETITIATANGISGTSSGGANPTLTLALGAITPTSVFIQGTSLAPGELRLYEDTDDGTNYSALRGVARTTDITYIMPSVDPTAGQILTSTVPAAGIATLSWTTVASSSLVHWIEAVSIAAPNATVPAVSWTVVNAATNVDAAIVAKGTGATLAQVPDNLLPGGNKRGVYATDWQKLRLVNTQVASGANSCILGGENNRASGVDSIVVGGYSNIASNTRSAVVGGLTNTASGDTSFVGCAQDSVASGAYSAVLNGRNNLASGNEAVCINRLNTASSDYTFAAGFTSIASAFYAASFGRGSKSYMEGGITYASGGSNGTTQGNLFEMHVTITGTAITELLTGGGTRAILANGTNSVWNAQIQIVASIVTVGNGTVAVGDSLVATYNVGIKRLGAATTLVGTPQLVGSVMNDAGMGGALTTITADNTNEALKIEFTPPTLAGSTTVTNVLANLTVAQIGF